MKWIWAILALLLIKPILFVLRTLWSVFYVIFYIFFIRACVKMVSWIFK